MNKLIIYFTKGNDLILLERTRVMSGCTRSKFFN